MSELERVRFIGASDDQVRWGGNDDPRKVLEFGEVYEIENVHTYSTHTKFKLKGIQGAFNSVSFEPEII